MPRGRNWRPTWGWQLGRAAGYKVGAGAFNAALQRLRALGLVGEAEGGLRASPAFFGE